MYEENLEAGTLLGEIRVQNPFREIEIDDIGELRQSRVEKEWGVKSLHEECFTTLLMQIKQTMTYLPANLVVRFLQCIERHLFIV